MKTEHLSEEEIQQYVLQNRNGEKKIVEHVQACQQCRIEVQKYNLLFTAIKAQPQASFDYNLVDSVLGKLPNSKPLFDPYLVFFITGLAMLGIGLVFFLFRSELFNMFSRMAPLVVYLILLTAGSILGFLSIDIYIKFLKQNEKLNYY